MRLSLITFVAVAMASPLTHAAGLPRTTPEAQGVDSAALLHFIEAANKIDSVHSVMVVRHGGVVAEGWWAPYKAEHRHMLYSLSKSFTSTAVGLAVAEGKLSIDDPVLKFFPDEAPASPSNNLKAMRVSDLLRMNTGHQTEPPIAPANVSWVKSFLGHPVPFKPGTHFLYNTPATYMQSAVVQKVTGQKLIDYLKPRLFDPLGIEDPTWESSPQGINTGGYGLSVKTEDIAKFGQLYLQRGRWKGKQLVPANWIEAATARQTSNGSNPNSDWDQGYGYQFWRSRNGAYRGDGAFGQFCIVIPEHDAVVAITSGVRDMQAVLNLVWDKLLPAFKAGTLSENADAQARLGKALKGLQLPPVTGSAEPAKVLTKRFDYPKNNRKLESITLEADDDRHGTVTLVAKFDGLERRIACKSGAWIPGKAGWGATPEQPLAASGAWTASDTFTAKVCFVETPYHMTMRLRFAGDECHVTTETNVGFGPTKAETLVGKAK